MRFVLICAGAGPKKSQLSALQTSFGPRIRFAASEHLMKELGMMGLRWEPQARLCALRFLGDSALIRIKDRSKPGLALISTLPLSGTTLTMVGRLPRSFRVNSGVWSQGSTFTNDSCFIGNPKINSLGLLSEIWNTSTDP